MFADYTNLFSSSINVNDFFLDMNSWLNKISLWFEANKLSLNLTKMKYSLFNQALKKREPLPFFKMDYIIIER